MCRPRSSRHGGGFADVFDGKYNGARVALKRFGIFRTAPQSHLDTIKQEIYRESLLWRVVAPKHVMPFYGISEHVTDIPYMVLPWMEKGNIRHHMDNLKLKGEMTGSTFASVVDNWL